MPPSKCEDRRLNETSPAPAAVPAKNPRVISVDALRGFDMFWILGGDSLAAAHRRVLRRFVLLFVLALIYAGGLSKLWPDIRLLGVLNRIALCYPFASLLFLNLRWRGLIAACVSLLVGYWVLMTFVPVPGIGAGVFEPGAGHLLAAGVGLLLAVALAGFLHRRKIFLRV